MAGWVIVLAALVGAVAGSRAPAVVAALPEPPRDPDDPPKVPYRELAAHPRLALVGAVLTAVVAALLATARGASADLPAFVFLAILGVVLAWVDVRVHRLPDRLTLPAFVGGVVLLGLAALVDDDWGAFGRAWLGAAVLFAFYLTLALIRPADMGLGDVKLAAVLGLYLGWLGWAEVISGAFLGFLLGGLSGVVLLLARRVGRRSAIPFGPFMLLGALIAMCAGRQLVEFYWGTV